MHQLSRTVFFHENAPAHEFLGFLLSWISSFNIVSRAIRDRARETDRGLKRNVEQTWKEAFYPEPDVDLLFGK